MNGPRGPGPVLVVGTQSIHVRRFVRGLCEVGQEVVLVTNTAEPLVHHPRLLAQETVDFSVISVKSLRTPARIRAAVARWRPSVVHVHQANSVAWHAARALRASGLPMVLTLWGSDVLTLPRRGRLHRAMVRHALRAAAAWTADARTVLEAAREVAGPGARAVEQWIPLGIDELPAAPAAGEDAPVHERRMLSCRLHKPLYRIDAIVRAFAQAAPACPGWVLEVAASGEETPALQRLATELKLGARVAFTGMLDAPALARAYRRSAVFVSVPASDGTSVSLLEAMAAGCLPVLSDLPANREWVRDADNGLLVGDLSHLASALQRAAAWWESGDWARAGEPANARLIAERATLRANVQQFLALHERVRQGTREGGRGGEREVERDGERDGECDGENGAAR